MTSGEVEKFRQARELFCEIYNKTLKDLKDEREALEERRKTEYGLIDRKIGNKDNVHSLNVKLAYVRGQIDATELILYGHS